MEVLQLLQHSWPSQGLFELSFCQAYRPLLPLGFLTLLHEAAGQDSTGSGTVPSKTINFSLT